MINDIVSTAIGSVMPYLAPIVFLIGAFTVSDRLRDLIVNAFTKAAYGTKRRGNY